MQGPLTKQTLNFLQFEYEAGRLRRHIEAIVLFDEAQTDQMKVWRQLQSYTGGTHRVQYDETAACVERFSVGNYTEIGCTGLASTVQSLVPTTIVRPQRAVVLVPSLSLASKLPPWYVCTRHGDGGGGEGGGEGGGGGGGGEAVVRGVGTANIVNDLPSGRVGSLENHRYVDRPPLHP